MPALNNDLYFNKSAVLLLSSPIDFFATSRLDDDKHGDAGNVEALHQFTVVYIDFSTFRVSAFSSAISSTIGLTAARVRTRMPEVQKYRLVG